MKKNYAVLLFILLLTGVSLFYNYQDIAFKRPQSVHKWRQSDCASIALNYYQGGMHFFDSETHNLTSDNGKDGKCCTSETPILYFTVAVLYKIFGYHDFVYRIFNMLLFFLGLFFLFRLLHYLLKDVFWSITLSLLFFTSPVLVYYGNNFLSNSSAFAFSIIGWYYFIRFLFESKQKWFYISIVVFLIAAALKVTALFSLFAITGIFILELSGLLKIRENGKLFNHPVRYSVSIASVFLLIGLWIVHAHNFNKMHDCSYFSTNIFPVWELNREQIKGVFENIRKIWLPEYFHISVLAFLAICFFILLGFFRKANKVLIYSIIFIFAEVIIYIVLQFSTFADHDYYTIDMYILPILIVIGTFDILKRHFNKIFTSIIFKWFFSLLLLFNIYYAHQKINSRYEGWMNDYPQNKDFYSVTPYLRQIGITANDTVISIPDYSHASLYLMNQKGWTEYTDAKFNRGTRVHYNQDSAGIQSSINKGAKYLIVNGIKEIYDKPYLKPFCTNLAGKYNQILIFNLRSKVKNFDIEERTIIKKLYCSAELLSSDKQSFLGENDSISFLNGNTRSDKMAHTGKYSSKVEASSPYGMGFKFKDLKSGESFKISVFRKSTAKSKGSIIASSSPFPYYNSENTIKETGTDGWEKIVMDVFISDDLAGQELVIYVYNPESDPVYFDDLEIIRYKSLYDTKDK